MTQNPFINGELTALAMGRNRATAAVNAYDQAIAALTKLIEPATASATGTALNVRALTPRERAVRAYVAGEGSATQIGKRFGVSGVTIGTWVKRAGHKMRPQGAAGRV